MLIKPGIYKDLSNKKYHADSALSHSGMEKLAITAAHFKVKLKTTAAMMFGSALHCKVLEPHLFDTLFEVVPKAGYKTLESGIITIPEKNEVSRGYNDILEIVKALKAHPIASVLLSGGEPEVSYFWKHELGIMCKARPDYKRDTTLIDLKSCIDASLIGFGKAASNFGYVRQADWYMTGVAACGVSVEQFVFIAVEKKPPYAVGIYVVSDEDLIVAHEENEALAAKYGECLKADKWPGYSEDIQPLALPAWHKPLII